jgi:predicted NUDIX family NTP pyrophosphohydrolase
LGAGSCRGTAARITFLETAGQSACGGGTGQPKLERPPTLTSPPLNRSETSAGILAYRRRNGLEVLLAHPGGPYWRSKDLGAWSIPKGVVESGDPLVCAKREFNEETGLVADGALTPLTPLKQRSGKTVHAFALEADFDITAFSSNLFEMEWPPRSGTMQKFPEVDRIAYFDLPTARKKILPGQRGFLDELVRKLANSEE